MPCKELSDVRLRTVGVIGRSLLLSELELGALRTGGFPVAVDGAIGDEGGKAVATAVESRLSDRVALSVDCDILEGSSSRSSSSILQHRQHISGLNYSTLPYYLRRD